MLDERIELAEYTCDIGEGMPQRLTYLNITNGLSGVPRALKVIARYALYDLGMNPEQVVNLLNAWCGFEINTIEESKNDHSDIFFRLQNWLPNYLEFLGRIDISHGLGIEKAKKELLQRKREWNLFTLEEGEKSTENKINFLKVISDAYHEGKLQVRYFVVEKNPFLHTSCKDDATMKKFLLKTAALYCTMATETKKKIRIGYPELSNWIGSGCLQSKKVNKFVTNILYIEGNVSENLFVKETVEGNHNICKIILSQKWLLETGAKIIAEEELEFYKSKEDVWIYKDEGCTKELLQL